MRSIRDERIELDYPVGFTSGWTLYVRAVLRVSLSDCSVTLLFTVGFEMHGQYNRRAARMWLLVPVWECMRVS